MDSRSSWADSHREEERDLLRKLNALGLEQPKRPKHLGPGPSSYHMDARRLLGHSAKWNPHAGEWNPQAGKWNPKAKEFSLFNPQASEFRPNSRAGSGKAFFAPLPAVNQGFAQMPIQQVLDGFLSKHSRWNVAGPPVAWEGATSDLSYKEVLGTVMPDMPVPGLSQSPHAAVTGHIPVVVPPPEDPMMGDMQQMCPESMMPVSEIPVPDSGSGAMEMMQQGMTGPLGHEDGFSMHDQDGFNMQEQMCMVGMVQAFTMIPPGQPTSQVFIPQLVGNV